ncbi:MAG: hypothetical protein MPN21_23895, partial [Thermoanaerobaculia bacterium]|nr:hypothetical protein [Thermoanaerobaculia bacterium]
ILRERCGVPHTVVDTEPDLAPGVSLWPLDPGTGAIRLQPAGLPEGVTRDELSVLPANRDSSDYQTVTMPGLWSGHELFTDLAIPGSQHQFAEVSDWLVVSYGAGIEVWDIGTDPASPVLIDQRDGWTPPFGPGHWAVFPPAGEMDTFLQSVEVIEEPDRLLIAIAGLRSAGFVVWVFDKLTGSLDQVYQDPWNVDANDLSMVRDPNGKAYAFVTNTGTQGNDGGIWVYDVTTAADTALCVDVNGSHSCGVFVGEMADLPKSRYVSALVVGEEIYVAASDGLQTSGLLTFEIWEVEDPENPATSPGGSSTLKYSGLGDHVYSPQLFTFDGSHFVALVEDVGANPNPDQMRIHQIGHCLDADGCSDLGSALATETIKNSFPSDQYLDLSFSLGLPFLHYGMQTTGLFGDGFERLWELEELPDSFAADTLPELTDGGGTYTDPCHDQTVGYFGEHYEGNDFGVRRFRPRHAVFAGRYLYRAAMSILDVHHRRSESTTQIFADGFESGTCQSWSAGCP